MVSGLVFLSVDVQELQILSLLKHNVGYPMSLSLVIGWGVSLPRLHQSHPLNVPVPQSAAAFTAKG